MAADDCACAFVTRRLQQLVPELAGKRHGMPWLVLKLRTHDAAILAQPRGDCPDRIRVDTGHIGQGDDPANPCRAVADSATQRGAHSPICIGAVNQVYRQSGQRMAHRLLPGAADNAHGIDVLQQRMTDSIDHGDAIGQRLYGLVTAARGIKTGPFACRQDKRDDIGNVRLTVSLTHGGDQAAYSDGLALAWETSKLSGSSRPFFTAITSAITLTAI